jgi:integrase
VDVEHGLIRVRHSWDRVEGFIEPKSRAGRRRVPLTNELRGTLLHHRGRQGHGGHGFVFGASPTTPFHPNKSIWCAQQAWKRARLAPIGFHQCRHTYASFMIAAGVNAEAPSTYMRHTSITPPLTATGICSPGNETEAAGLLEQWLEANAGSVPTG